MADTYKSEKEGETVIVAIKTEILDELLKDYKSPEDLLGEGGILKELTKRLV